MEYLGIIFFACIIVGFGVILTVVTRVARKKRSHCNSCKAQYNYESDIGWEVTSSVYRNGNAYAKVRIECTCPICGKTKVLTKEIKVAGTNSSGNYEEHNLEHIVRKMFL